uniref:Uncharacterized protein n=1 Tax=Acrobeloides nanus TaxID=290746 RepID=A0A914CTU2_9BILA
KTLDNSTTIPNNDLRRKVISVIHLPSTKVKAQSKDPARFQGNGLDFKGKFIGERDVTEARGMAMFSEAMRLAKASVKQSGSHKPRIFLNVSMDGLKIKDERNSAILYRFPVEKVSFIARDSTDYRAFGFIFTDENGKFKFFGIKTALSSEHAYSAISELLQLISEMKKNGELKQKEAFLPENEEITQGIVCEPDGCVVVGDLLDLDTSLDENLSSNPIPEDSLSANLHIASSTPTRLSPNPFGDSDSVTNGHSTEISPQSLNMKKRPAPPPPSSNTGMVSLPSLADAINDPHAIAKYVYISKETNELFCEPNDILLLKKKLDPHWVFACNLRTGVAAAVPVAFLDIKVALQSASPTSESFRPDDSTISKFNAPTNYMAKAIHDYCTGVEGDLSFKAGDWINVVERVNEHWLRGELFGQRGIFPLSFVQLENVQAIPMERPKSANSMSDSFSYPKVTVTSIHDYTSDVPEDLSFKIGDVIEIIKYVNEDWIMGRLHDRAGLVPLNFVKQNN